MKDQYLASLGALEPYYQEIESTLLDWNHEIEVIPHVETNSKGSFRFYLKGKFICYCFIFDDYLDIMTRFHGPQVFDISTKIDLKSKYAKDVWDRKYPCGQGAWIHYHVNNKVSTQEALWFLHFRFDGMQKKKKQITYK